MGNCSVLVNNCIAHHNKELYIENKEKRFQRSHLPSNDTPEKKNKRRTQFEQDFLQYQHERMEELETNISDTEKIENYKKFTNTL